MENGFKLLKQRLFIPLMQKIKPIFEEEEKLEEEKREYNIFEVLNIERKEVNLHSYFIYYLLNPNSSHKQSIFLQLFLTEVLRYSKSELQDFNPEDYEVQREVNIDKGRIDFLIYNHKNKKADIIEMKIDAPDQPLQLERYSHYAKEKFKNKYKMYYLTLDGKEASAQSANNIKYTQISFEVHIIDWLKKSLKKIATDSKLAIDIMQYMQTIKKITDIYINEEIMKKYLKCLKTNEELNYAIRLVRESKRINDRERKRILLSNSEKELVKNEKYIKKLEEILPMKVAEIESRFWKIVLGKIQKKYQVNSIVDLESVEDFTQFHIDIFSIKLTKIKSNDGNPMYLRIGRKLKNKNGIYFSISDGFLKGGDSKYVRFLKKIHKNISSLSTKGELTNWKENGWDVYSHLKKGNVSKIFNQESEFFYPILETKD